MPYKYRERLKKGGDRFDQVNTVSISYARYQGNTIEVVSASTVLLNPQIIDPNGALVRTERQLFIINIRDLVDDFGYFLPRLGDTILTSDVERFEIIRESDNSPIFQYVTADRTVEHGRIILTTQRIER